MLLHETEDLVGVGALGHDDRTAREQDGQDVHSRAAGAKEGRDRDRDVVGAEIDDRQEVDDVPRHVAVGQHDSLRPARGARRMRKQAEVLELRHLFHRRVR